MNDLHRNDENILKFSEVFFRFGAKSRYRKSSMRMRLDEVRMDAVRMDRSTNVRFADDFPFVDERKFLSFYPCYYLFPFV